MNIYAEYGQYVIFSSKNGRDDELSYAKQKFTPNQILQVLTVERYDFDSAVKFIEFPYEWFNTVMFEDVIVSAVSQELEWIPLK